METEINVAENPKTTSKYWNEILRHEEPILGSKTRMSFAVALAAEARGETEKANTYFDKAIESDAKGE